jgi:hypothetical protein
VAGDVPIGRLVAALAELSEREMLGKLSVHIDTYFSHNLSCLNSTYGAVTLCSSVAASEDHGSRLPVPGLFIIIHKNNLFTLMFSACKGTKKLANISH